jgi:hypothetical protein
MLCERNPRCDFYHQQTGDSTGKFVFNKFRTRNTWFRRTRTTDQEDITRMIRQEGEVSGLNGKMTGNLRITYQKC